MPRALYEESTAASAIGTNIASGNRDQSSPFPRVHNRIAVVGSTAAGDAQVDVFFGEQFIGRFPNTTGGAAAVPQENRDWIPLAPDLANLPAENVNVLIQDAGAANVIRVFVEYEVLEG